MDNFKILYKILHTLEIAMDSEQFDMSEISHERFGITEARWCQLIKMLIDNGYIEGITLKYTLDGEPILGVTRPAITLKGLEYLEENSMMKKAYRLIKGIKEVTSGM